MDEDIWGNSDYNENANETYTIQCERIEDETNKAYLVIIENKEYWFPKSQVELDIETLELKVPMWLIEEKGLEDLVEYEYD